MSASYRARVHTVACKDEFEAAERGGDSADGKNRDSLAKTLDLPPVQNSKETLTVQKKKRGHIRRSTSRHDGFLLLVFYEGGTVVAWSGAVALPEDARRGLAELGVLFVHRQTRCDRADGATTECRCNMMVIFRLWLR
jgi:hypothetical protein